MTRRVLVANRGEIAVRVIRAARDLGIETVAVYSAADRDAAHVALADRAVCIGPAAAAGSYLRADLLLHTAIATGCDAVHPGYGFLSEDAGFAERVEREGLTFVGPPSPVIEQLGNKVTARGVAQRAEVPIVPGSPDAVADVEEAARLAKESGYPVLLKARAGGGGRGMRVVGDEQQLRAAFPLASHEAAGAFGDDGLYVERYLTRVRHVEVQILADQYGHVEALGERDCTLQRRHQKVLEEAPCPVLSGRQREEICAAAVRVARAAGYVNAGTVEFLFDLDSQSFFFIEMNTRIQVEHPITELLTGVDLVAWQFRVADGQKVESLNAHSRGHAIECRITAEDWRADFLPSPGRLAVFEPPAGPGVRVDSHCRQGTTITPHYDSLLAKLIVHGTDRGEALCRAKRALDEFRVEGVHTSVGMHRWLLEQPAVIEGNYTTNYLTEAL
ncbi:MAG: acetyl-CoA carboxylase biotin carboxylase subunit [Pseudonocardiaceae bacterium]|nr:acetyl-CoA carboxylase biotin carboxylase subunit [Pseudonocardiaceae bacterium]